MFSINRFLEQRANPAAVPDGAPSLSSPLSPSPACLNSSVPEFPLPLNAGHNYPNPASANIATFTSATTSASDSRGRRMPHLPRRASSQGTQRRRNRARGTRGCVHRVSLLHVKAAHGSPAGTRNCNRRSSGCVVRHAGASRCTLISRRHFIFCYRGSCWAEQYEASRGMHAYLPGYGEGLHRRGWCDAGMRHLLRGL